MSVRVMSLVMDGGPEVSSQRFVLLAIADHAGDDGRAFPHQELLAEKTALSENTVRTALNALEAGGFLTIRRREARVDTVRGSERKGCLYCLNLPVLEARASSVRAAREVQRTGRVRERRPQAVEVGKQEWHVESTSYETPTSAIEGGQDHQPGSASSVTSSVEKPVEEAAGSIGFPRDDLRRGSIQGVGEAQSSNGEPQLTGRRTSIDVLPNKEEPSKNHQEPSGEPEELKAPPAAGQPVGDGSAEKARLWTVFQQELKTDLASVPLNLAALRDFTELQPGVNDFETAFRDWWLLEVQQRSWGTAFLVGARDAVATRQGCVKYAARLAKIARKVYGLSPNTPVRFVVEQQRAA